LEWDLFVPDDQPRNYLLSYFIRALTAVGVLLLCALIVSVLLATAPKAGQVQTVITPQPVKVFEAHQVSMQRQWRGYGVAAAVDRADIPSRVTTTVVTIPTEIQAGRIVTAKTTVIALLDATDFQRQLDQAKERLAELDAQLKLIDVEVLRYAQRLKLEEEDVALARTEGERIERLVKIDAAKQFESDGAKRAVLAAQRIALSTQELIDKIPARKEALKAMRDAQESVRLAAKENVDRCTITSPIDGILQSVDVKVGESLSPGQRVARVVSLARIEVPVQLPVAARADLILGGRVELRATNETQHCFDATIVRISPADDSTTRTMTVYAEVMQKNITERFGTAEGGNLITPGQFLAATSWSDSTANRWIVPRRSIRAGRVLVVEGGIVSSKPVTIDYLDEGANASFGVPDDQWAVLTNDNQPLKAGDLVVLNASVSLRDGDKVSPVKAVSDVTAAPDKTTAEKTTAPQPTP